MLLALPRPWGDFLYSWNPSLCNFSFITVAHSSAQQTQTGVFMFRAALCTGQPSLLPGGQPPGVRTSGVEGITTAVLCMGTAQVQLPLPSASPRRNTMFWNLLVVLKEENTNKPQLHRIFWKSWKCRYFTSRAGFLHTIFNAFFFAKNRRKYWFRDEQTGLTKVRCDSCFFTFFELRFMVWGFVVFEWLGRDRNWKLSHSFWNTSAFSFFIS